MTEKAYVSVFPAVAPAIRERSDFSFWHQENDQSSAMCFDALTLPSVT